MRRVFAFVGLLFVALSAWAIQCTQYSTRTNQSSLLTATSTAFQWVETKQQACNLSAGTFAAASAVGVGKTVTPSSGSSEYTWNYLQGTAPNQTTIIVTVWAQLRPEAADACRVVYNYSYEPGVYRQAWQTGYSTRTGDYCGVECESGTQSIKNATVGWFRSANPSSGIPDLKPDGTSNADKEYPKVGAQVICMNNCRWSFSGLDVTDAWVSQQPSPNGFYRASADFRMTSVGATCVPSGTDTAAGSPQGMPTGPVCDGYEGYVNDKKVCIPKVPGTSDTSPRTESYRQGNPTAGSEGGGGTGSTANIPASPPSGASSGTNAGGGSASGDGKIVLPNGTVITPTPSAPATGTKTAVAGEEQLACGAPGQPKCVIDESGTPTGGKDGLSDLNTADQQRSGGITSILDKSGKDTSFSMPGWLQPSSNCAAWNLGKLPEPINVDITIDFCSLKPYVEGVVSFLWIVGTFLACLGMVGRVMGTGAN